MAYEESLNTLKYATRAGNIKTHSIKNTVKHENKVEDYNEIINKLKSENDEMRLVKIFRLGLFCGKFGLIKILNFDFLFKTLIFLIKCFFLVLKI